jgi:hypothetical protein
MSIENGTTTLTVKIVERTWKVECFCEYGTDYTLLAHRERLHLLDDGTILSRDRNLPSVRRSVLMVQGNAKAMSMLAATKELCDDWAAEDAAATPQPS